MRTVRFDGRTLEVFDDRGAAGYNARLFRLGEDGWSPPLPDDIEVPTASAARSSTRATVKRSAEPPSSRPFLAAP